MLARFEHKSVTWIDLENPTAEEIAAISEEFELGHLLIEELLTPTARPRVDVYPGFVYAVLHFPAARYTHGAELSQEIDIILGNKFIITTHYSTTSATYDLGKAFEAADLLPAEKNAATVGWVFSELAKRLYQAADNELDALEGTIESIEENIFQGKERTQVSAISLTNRELLNHKRLLATHRDIIEALEKATAAIFSEDVARYVRSAHTLHYRVHARAVMLHEVLNELRETNLALLYTRQNEIMKNLTIMAFVTFPLTLIAGLFGMNTSHTPIVGTPNDFYWIISGMAVLMFVFFFYFKLKKWF